MLQKLTIRNVALIECAELEFSRGLNVLSGETGAGKSVILDAIDFVLGAKADRRMIRSGCDHCVVQAEFSCGPRERALLSEYDIDRDETLLLSRRLTADGKSTLKVNGCTVTSSMLRRLTAQLVDVHGQSEHFFLLKESNQLKLIDDIAGEPLAAEKRRLGELLSVRRALRAERESLGGNAEERNRRADILHYQIGEIERAELREGEEEELLAFRERCRNAEKILNALNGAREFLRADGGCADGANGAKRCLDPVAKFDEQYAVLADRLEAVTAEIEDIADTAEQIAESFDIDAGEAERAEARLDELRSLKKKYGGSVREILAFLARAQEEYEALSDSEARCEKIAAETKLVNDDIFAVCRRMDALRREAAASFCRRVVAELQTLNIPSAQFCVQFSEFSREDAEDAGSEGLGGVVFLFSANKGEPLKELGKIISGGEMSRFMLAVKAQLSSVNAIGSYIFDEIDAGIGGKTAWVVGEKFCAIAQNVQVIAVSHLAQIASFADRAFYIEKQEAEGRTYSVLHTLEGAARLREIARLIGGEESDAALRHAAELLEKAAEHRRSLA